MLELRFHGRGGQGTVQAAQLLARALVQSGKYAQFIPAFGVERKGSPVFGYFRLDDKPIRPKNKVYYPDGLVVLDDSLWPEVNVFEGVREHAFLLLNTKKSPDTLELPKEIATAATVDATEIAREIVGAEIPNTVVLGALTRMGMGMGIDFHTLSALVGGKFGAKNADAFKAGYDRVQIVCREETK